MTLGLFPLLWPALVAAPPPVVVLPPPPAPVLYVRFNAPEKAVTLFRPGTPMERGFPGSTTVAMRPGYIYRFGISWPDAELNLKPLYPSIEIRGSLNAPPGFDFGRYPVPIQWTPDEIERIRGGAMITKVIYLEHPDRAAALQTDPNEPLQFGAFNEDDAFKESALRGRVVAIVRVGERDYSPDELAAFDVAGTILLPGEPVLAPAASPPIVPCVRIPLYDPILGYRADDDQCLHDGGDTMRLLGIDNQGRLRGLDPSDTSMEFTQGKRRQVVSSNRVCLCVPRFVTYVADTLPTGFDGHREPLVELRRQQGVPVIALRTPALTKQVDILELMRGRQGLRVTLGQFGLAQNEMMTRPIAIASRQGVGVIAEVVGPKEIATFSDCDMLLTKWVEPEGPHQIGDVVTFFLRYANPTAVPLDDVVVSDSLTPRLEYIPNSAKADRAANFTISSNDVGSSILRWQIPGTLEPGKKGVVAFQARIR